LRRYDAKGELVATKFDASEPAQMQKAIEANSKPALTAESRAEYNKMIESADKLDRVAMARTIENNEKFVMSHTTAFLWETRFQQLQKQGDEQAIRAKEAELAQKPVLSEQVKKVREGNASDSELGKLLSSSVDTRVSYMAALLNQDSVKQYMSGKDKALETDTNVTEARKVVAELAKLNPSLTNKLQPTARLLGMKELAPTGR
jgi:hypothetical protein